MKQSPLAKLLALFAILSLLLVTGCTHMIRPPKEPYSHYTAQEKINLKVGLNITNELRKAEWVKAIIKEKWVMPVGEYLATNSEVLARHVFANVTMLSGSALAAGADIDAVLTPNLAYINRTMGATSFGKSIISVKVEWKLESPEGKIIWVQTVGGESSGSTGWTNPKVVLKRALEDLLAESQKSIAAAEAIRRYAAERAR